MHSDLEIVHSTGARFHAHKVVLAAEARECADLLGVEEYVNEESDLPGEYLDCFLRWCCGVDLHLDMDNHDIDIPLCTGLLHAAFKWKVDLLEKQAGDTLTWLLEHELSWDDSGDEEIARRLADICDYVEEHEETFDFAAVADIVGDFCHKHFDELRQCYSFVRLLETESKLAACILHRFADEKLGKLE